jgi:trimethylamine--corrinoid protein Co-methyltransferase
MIQSNQVVLNSPYYRRLTDCQLDRLHDASLEILERTGVRFQEEEAISLFKSAGCDVLDGDRVHIPAWRVQWALNLAPKQIILYDQTGVPKIRLSGRKAYYGNGSDLLFIIDHETSEHRQPVLQDVVNIVKLLDSLDNYSFVMSGFIPSDIDSTVHERMQMLAMLQNTNKPIIYVTTSDQATRHCIAMAEATAGSEGELRRYPFAVNYINITHPLRHNPDSIQKLLWLSGKGLPFVYRPSIVTRGLSTPVTPAGFLAVNNAATLAGLVLSQLKREGAPFIRCSCAGGTFDMKTTVGLHSAPEIRGFNEELARYYKTPSFGIGGTSASKMVDQQAAMEAAMTLLTSTLAGAQLIHDVGYMDSGTTTSLNHMLICDEMISWVRKFMEGLKVDCETLGLDMVHQVGPDGDHLSSQHTFAHFKEDESPDLRDHRRYEDWLEDGATSLEDRARVKVNKIIGEHQSPEMDQEVLARLNQIIAE